MPKRIQNSENEHRLLAIAAARLRSENLTRGQIALRLKKSQPEVSRLISYAEEHLYLAKSPSFLIQNVSVKDLDEVDRRFFVPGKLRDALRRLAPARCDLDVRVLPEGDEAFAMAAASCVGELLLHARVVGIMWGRSLARLVSRIRGCLDASGQGAAYDVQCIPLCGDPLHLMNLGQVQYSASQLAAALGQALKTGHPSDQPCLVGVPAYLRREFFLHPGGPAGWQDFVHEIPGYRSIFGSGNGNEKPWVERVDTIISGAGIIAKEGQEKAPTASSERTAAHEETGDFIRERLAQEGDISEASLGKLIYGDIGGLLLGREDLPAGDRRLVDSLNQGWTGISADHLLSVARSAKPGGPPGVILVAAGATKAEMIRQSVKRGFVNRLLIDLSLAKALSSHCR